MLKSLKIRGKIFQSNLIQAPLAGISCAPFRELVWQFGDVAYCCTEMLSAVCVATGSDSSPRFYTRFDNEKTLCWQLSGNNPEILARAAEKAIAAGADVLDLNCGCPQPKIRKKNCGSKLLSDEKKLGELIKAMQVDKKIPVTVKMRIDANRNEYDDVSVAKIIEAAGADAIIVHGRNWSHDYTVPCQLDAIAHIVSAVDIPVIANGDIDSSTQIKTVFEKTNCAGFMIARASVGQPWIYQKIVAELNNQLFTMPSQKTIGGLFLKHIAGLIPLESERAALFQSRGFGKYYARTNEQKAQFLKELYRIDSFAELTEIIQQYF